jgi:ubiquinone/menaquinone biosynthesis C-methylase UbiE
MRVDARHADWTGRSSARQAGHFIAQPCRGVGQPTHQIRSPAFTRWIKDQSIGYGWNLRFVRRYLLHMTDDALPGAVIAPSPDRALTAELFDLMHETSSRSQLVWELSAQAYGDEYPAEVRPFGMTTWWVLGRFVSELRIGPGATLADLACGRGGPGLWVARATGANLIGVDWSSVAVESAIERAPEFLPAGRAHFQVGQLTDTNLPDSSADAVLCADAIFFANDRIAALREVARILRAGGRFVFTCDEEANSRRLSAVPNWTPLLEAAGLEVEQKEQIPRFAESLQRMYTLWLEHLDELRAELGDEAAAEMADEANAVGPTLAGRTALVVTARRP